MVKVQPNFFRYDCEASLVLIVEKFFTLAQLLEQHRQLTQRVERLLVDTDQKPNSECLSQLLKQTFDEEFSCRMLIARYNAVSSYEHRQKSIHLSAFMFAYNCPLHIGFGFNQPSGSKTP